MLRHFLKLDRRVIYLLVLMALSVPLLLGYTVTPARMAAAEKLFSAVEGLPTDRSKIALVSMDFGPSTIAENGSQAEVVIEHLLRRRIPFAVVSLLPDSAALLNEIPEKVVRRLAAESPGERWQYGIDWVNLGFLAGGYIAVQSIPKADDLRDVFKKDVRGNSLYDLPVTRNLRSINDVGLLYEVTGSPGTFEAYVQFFQTNSYRPIFGHGCTSIMTPQSYIYLDSGQLHGLLEGIAGAAWYSELLRKSYPTRAVDTSLLINTGLGVAHLVIIALVILGNIVGLVAWRLK